MSVRGNFKKVKKPVINDYDMRESQFHGMEAATPHLTLPTANPMRSLAPAPRSLGARLLGRVRPGNR